MLNIVYWIRGSDFAGMAITSAESMKRVYGESARVFVYADEQRDSLKDSEFIDQVITNERMNAMPAMIANLYAQVHFCKRPAFLERPTLFVDADVLAVQRAKFLDPQPEYDVLVTQRDHVGLDENGKKVVGVAEGMPYNYGVIACQPTPAAQEALIWMRERLAKMGGHLQAWYGNQWALREIVGGSYLEETPRLVERESAWSTIHFRVENCDQWNYTPETADADLQGVFFVHLKGERKDELFQAYADRLAA